MRRLDLQKWKHEAETDLLTAIENEWRQRCRTLIARIEKLERALRLIEQPGNIYLKLDPASQIAREALAEDEDLK